ncbi:restriction endonuclease subunit S [Micromonospora parva]|uniref:restriction endonuclease subunit S n=1 Tax=Micromonospora parva TaxID=1464048 RepID=UPI0033E9B536
MSEWPIVRFGDLAAPERASFAMGPFGSKITKENYVPTGGIPVVRGVNLGRGVFTDSDFVFIAAEKADELSSANVAPGDLIFTHRGTIGQVSMIPRRPRFNRYVIGSSQVKARLDESIAVSEFYYYWFRSPKGQHAILANVSTVGVPGLATPLTTIRNLQVPLPSKAEQLAISGFLGALDDKIAINQRIAATYEALLVAKFLSNGWDEEPVNPQDGVPLSALVDFNPAYPRPVTQDAVYVDMASIPTSSGRISSWTRRPPTSGMRFRNGDTVMARITPCLENGKTGFVDFMEDREVGVGSTEFIVLRARPGVPAHFTYLIARSPRFRQHAISNMVGTSGRQRCPVDVLPTFVIRRPNQEALRELGVEAEAAFAHMRSLDSESAALAGLRDTLLPKLIYGEMRIKDAERLLSAVV